MLYLQAIPFDTNPTIPYVDKQPWYERWAATVLDLKAERVHHEKQLTPTPEAAMPTPLSAAQENACRAAYGAMYAWQLWQGRCNKILSDAGKLTFEGTKLERPDPPGEWVHERMRSSLHAWNATFGESDGVPPPDLNEWNPKTYVDDGWGRI